MGVPNTFATQTGTIPLSELDVNFSTPITIGSTTIALGDSGLVPLADGVSGVLGVNHGGIGSSAAGTAGQVLISNGTTFGPGNLTAGANISITGGTTIAASGATAGTGVNINAGAVNINTSQTVAGGSHITLTPTVGSPNFYINAGSGATTLDINPATESFQRLTVQFKQGGTPQTLSFGSTVQQGSLTSTYVATTTPNHSDFLTFIGQGATWAFVGVSPDFNI